MRSSCKHLIRLTVAAGIGGMAAVILGHAPIAGAGDETAPPPIAAADAHVQARDPVAAGRYLVRVCGCNDCHTPGYRERNGDVPESEWLRGSPLGWKGPWGTSYAVNLRLLLKDLDDDTWVTYARMRDGNPPMPWWVLKTLSDSDLRAILAYVKSLPAAGESAPVDVPPGQPVHTPFIDMGVQMPPPETPAAPPAK